MKTKKNAPAIEASRPPKAIRPSDAYLHGCRDGHFDGYEVGLRAGRKHGRLEAALTIGITEATVALCFLPELIACKQVLLP